MFFKTGSVSMRVVRGEMEMLSRVAILEGMKRLLRKSKGACADFFFGLFLLVLGRLRGGRWKLNTLGLSFKLASVFCMEGEASDAL